MRVVHFSDIHLSKKNTLCNNRWLRARSQVLTGPIDFIVISGDIADHATEEDYAEAHEFLSKLLPLVKDDPTRIVIVPGNHDVDWAHPVGQRVDLAAKKEPVREQIRDAFRKGQSKPDLYRYRFKAQLEAPPEIWEINDYEYRKRFNNFRHFIEQFYGSRLDTPPHRRLGLSIYPNEHWSAHVFAPERVAFYGLNTCFANDEMCRAGAISSKALEEITQHIATHSSGLLNVAVWHHGLVTERGQADLLTFGELASLRETGFNLGLHGHTHRDEQKHIQGRLKRNLLVLGVGSFAADKAEREGGVHNQFSVLDIDDREIAWTVYDFEEREEEQIWKPRQKQTYPRRTARDGDYSVMTRNRIGQHERRAVVNEKGIATVTVTLKDVELDRKLSLGCPVAGASGIHFEKSCKLGGPGTQDLTVRVTQESTEVPHYVGEVNPPSIASIPEMTWFYVFANGFALDEVDAKAGRYPGKKISGLGDESGPWDAFAYCVSDATSELLLTLDLPITSKILEAKTFAQRPESPAPSSAWEPDPSPPPMKLETRSNGLSLTVTEPRVGSRYGVTYQLGPGKSALAGSYVDCVDAAVDACRGAPAHTPEPIWSHLTEEIGEVLATALKVPKGPDFWVAHLWDSRRRALVACFGKFPMEYWTSAFASGEGIAGHAFRMRQATIYHLPDAGQGEQPGFLHLLYREGDNLATERPDNKGHKWIIELPILLDTQHAVGTIGFARRRGDLEETPTRERLGRMAHDIAFSSAAPVGFRRSLDKTSREVSRVFWETWGRWNQTAKTVAQSWRRGPLRTGRS